MLNFKYDSLPEKICNLRTQGKLQSSRLKKYKYADTFQSNHLAELEWESNLVMLEDKT